MADRGPPSCIYILAGTNGAGKSNIAGAMFRAEGTVYFNPYDAAARIRHAKPHLSAEEANSHAWYHGKRLLERAIAQRLNLAFETTLGGNSIPAVLKPTPIPTSGQRAKPARSTILVAFALIFSCGPRPPTSWSWISLPISPTWPFPRTPAGDFSLTPTFKSRA